MKRVKELDFFKHIRQIREFEFGIFYYFDGLVISEMKEGIVLEWEMAELGVLAAKEIFKENQPIVYISNRIHNYSVDPLNWVKFYKNRHQLAHYAVVGRTQEILPALSWNVCFLKTPLSNFNTWMKH